MIPIHKHFALAGALLSSVVACISCSSIKTPAPGALPPERTLEFGCKVQELVPRMMARHHVPGVAMAVILDHRLCWHREFGVRKAGGKEPVDRNTLFEACSMSKPLFSYLVMRLAEQGRIALDTPLDSYLPKPYLPTQPAAGRITARMVMNHTTGLPNWRPGGWRKGGPLKLKAEPGSRFTYSGEGFTYLQTAVEHLTDRPVDDLLRHRLLTPLGMLLSTYHWVDRCEKNWARGHDKSGHPKNRAHYTRANTAYSLYTTPCEYARFLLVMMGVGNQGEHRLEPKSVERMLTKEVPCGKDTHKGLGWGIRTYPGGEYAFHGGSNGAGFRCFSRFDRSRGSGIVVMTNGDLGKKVYLPVLALWEQTLAPPCKSTP